MYKSSIQKAAQMAAIGILATGSMTDTSSVSAVKLHEVVYEHDDWNPELATAP